MIKHIKIKPIEYIMVYRVIRDLAYQHNITLIEARWVIRQAIEYAWDKAWTIGNIKEQCHWQQLFPADYCPTVEEFIVTIGREMKAGRNPPYLLEQ